MKRSCQVILFLLIFGVKIAKSQEPPLNTPPDTPIHHKLPQAIQSLAKMWLNDLVMEETAYYAQKASYKDEKSDTDLLMLANLKYYAFGRVTGCPKSGAPLKVTFLNIRGEILPQLIKRDAEIRSLPQKLFANVCVTKQDLLFFAIGNITPTLDVWSITQKPQSLKNDQPGIHPQDDFVDKYKSWFALKNMVTRDINLTSNFVQQKNSERLASLVIERDKIKEQLNKKSGQK